jgi:HK97 gp10 family phage protein
MIEMKILGLKELDDLLKKLPEDFQVKAGWKATLEAAKITRDKAIMAAPMADKPHFRYPYRGLKSKRGIRMGRKRHSPGEAQRVQITPGLVKRSMRAFRARVQKQGMMKYYVGPIGPRFGKDPARDPFYWKWLEYGKQGYAPRKFLRNSFDTSINQMIDTMRVALAKYIDNANKRVAKYRLPT